VLSGIALLAVAGLILAAVLGYVPERKWLIWSALAVAAVRLLFVDLLGYILPLSELKPFAYIPFASNACGLIAVCYLAPALRLRKAE
jgi:putative exporter of polyketide antibiotics